MPPACCREAVAAAAAGHTGLRHHRISACFQLLLSHAHTVDSSESNLSGASIEPHRYGLAGAAGGGRPVALDELRVLQQRPKVLEVRLHIAGHHLQSR